MSSDEGEQAARKKANNDSGRYEPSERPEGDRGEEANGKIQIERLLWVSSGRTHLQRRVQELSKHLSILWNGIPARRKQAFCDRVQKNTNNKGSNN